MTTLALILAGLAAIGAAVYFLWLRKTPATAVLPPLTIPSRPGPSIFQCWIAADNLNEDPEITTARHDLYWHGPEALGTYWKGRNGVYTSVSLAGDFEPSTIQAGLDTRARLKALNPDLLLFISVGYTEGIDAWTDFPIDHPWWLRDAQGNRVPGWGEGAAASFLFNLNLPEVRQHCANSCRNAWATGIWDGIFLDVFTNDALHVDILRRTRALIPNVPIIVNGRQKAKTSNSYICSDLAPFVNGFLIEAGQLTTPARWKTIQDAVDFNERNVRQPAMNCLEIAGPRNDERTMRATTCLALTRGGYALFADSHPLYASDHAHGWHPFWEKSLGNPIGSTMTAGNMGSRREFANGTAVYNPMGGQMVLLTFSEPRTSVATGVRSTTHSLPPGDGGIYLT